MQYSKDDVRKLVSLTFASAMEQADSSVDAAQLESKKALFMSDDNLDVLAMLFSALEDERMQARFSKKDKQHYAEETARVFETLKRGATPEINRTLISEIGLPARVYNQLALYGRPNIKTVGELLDMDAEQLNSLRQIGAKSILELQECVQGFVLRAITQEEE